MDGDGRGYKRDSGSQPNSDPVALVDSGPFRNDTRLRYPGASTVLDFSWIAGSYPIPAPGTGGR